ncbi:sigma-70 family RNA polymerase sigma factor [Anoxybacillus rupiensis]|uniref:Sigma-70 family RNA polymerase sigma factor n=1 Tax=Anoxybacteroides rupiense TaxID=311460 RepID=A0ABT5W287_9BACL|nr:sigma-70 family RNA polymerase sigma factor [Anoxybacillus rupiensis]MDE8563432.1 sigma-70 family RNA polymerase sigma factor [Anoxybacillus rupiensis]OQM47228.1 RNA polymerase subunit sigma [Anoxybacillus sp. UARK-01]QHC02917.1 sigma-70 family RNA polymerase sigma factor [Anoxybacillus sp. PDR2]
MKKDRKGESGIQDDVLIDKVQNGDEHALRMLIEKYRDYLYKTVYSIIRHEKDAEDATQEVLVRIFLSLSQYQSQGFKAWITRIAVNYAIDVKRKRERKREEALEATEPEAAENVEQLVIKKAEKEQVRRRLEEIPPSYREIIYAYYIEEKSYQQIAKEQNIAVKTVETKLYRARNWLRKHWKEGDFQ